MDSDSVGICVLLGNRVRDVEVVSETVIAIVLDALAETDLVSSSVREFEAVPVAVLTCVRDFNFESVTE